MNRFASSLALAAALLAVGGCQPAPPDAASVDVDMPADAVAEAPADAASADGAAAVSADDDGAMADATGADPAEAEIVAAPVDDGALDPDEVANITQVVSNTFRNTMQAADPAWQDVIVRELSTDQLSALRGQPEAPRDDARVARGNLWVVGFRTTLPVTLADLPPDNPFDLAPDGPLDASQADENGLTSVYYVLGTSQEVGGPKQYTLLSRGILPPGSSWTLDDLAATGIAP